MKCRSLRRTCRECGRKNDKHAEKCEGCGADMHCGNNAVHGYTLCINHGGPVPSRDYFGKGAMMNGKGSSFPLMRLAARYNEMSSDGVVLSNRKAIDLIDIRIKQLLERVDVGEAPDRVAKLYELWNEFKNTDPNSTDYLLTKNKLEETFEKVYHDYMAWNQIFTALELRGKSVEREVKALKEIKAIMTAEDGYQLTAKMMAAVIRVIGDDPKKLKQVQYEFSRIIGESSDNITEGNGQDNWGDGETGGGEAGSGDLDQAELLYTGNQE